MEETIYDSGFQESMSIDPFVYESASTANPAVGAGVMLFVFVIAIAIYIYTAYCLQQIAKKTNTPNDWLAWIPIANVVLMLQIAGLPIWWLLGLLIPFVNIVVAVYVWWKISEVRNRPGWWGLLMLISPVNLILLWFLAFREGTTPPMVTPPTVTPPTMTNPQPPTI